MALSDMVCATPPNAVATLCCMSCGAIDVAPPAPPMAPAIAPASCGMAELIEPQKVLNQLIDASSRSAGVTDVSAVSSEVLVADTDEVLVADELVAEDDARVPSLRRR